MAERKKATAKASTKAPKAAASTPKGTKPDGSISAGIYDTVEKLVAGGKMTRAAAFRQVAKQTGRKEGTVAVNYYYAAKKRGATSVKRGRPMRAAARTTGGTSRIESLLRSIEELVRAQTAELESLRRENSRFAQIKKLFA